jgi:hypothetical protein
MFELVATEPIHCAQGAVSAVLFRFLEMRRLVKRMVSRTEHGSACADDS